MQAHDFAPCIDIELTLLTEDGIFMASARTENLRAQEFGLVLDDGFAMVPTLKRLIKTLCDSIM